MPNPITVRKLSLLNEFTRHWQDVAGSELLFLALNGEIKPAPQAALPIHWAERLREISPTQAALLIFPDQTVLAAPLFYDQQLLGYLVAPNTGEQYLSLLTWGAETIAARMLDEEALQGMTEELIEAWEQLELIYQVTRNLTLTLDLFTTLKSILQDICRVAHTADGFILLQRAESLDCVTCNILGLEQSVSNETLLDDLIRINRVVLCNDVVGGSTVWLNPPLTVECFLATSLLIPDEDCQAAFGLVNKADKNFTAGDVKLLAALAQQVSAIIKNLLVHQRLISKERLSRELEIAAEIQESLLPINLPEVNALAIAVVYMPASEVGGDFYDFITLDDHQLTVVIGDVAGKGVPAAMLTSVIRTLLRVEAMRGEPPHTIIHRANTVLHQDLSQAESFVTAFVATLDTLEGKLSYASAGHCPVILYRADNQTTELLKATSPPVGIFGYQGDSTRTEVLNPGDTLIFYTDGITEAESLEGEYFGLDRLLHLVQQKAGEPPDFLLRYIQAEVANFCRGSFSRDDATLLVIKVLPQAETSSPRNGSEVVKTIDFSYPADTKYLVEIAREITDTCRQVPLLPSGPNANDFIYLIELAISEICTNIIQHAYAGRKGGEITGSITLMDNGIHLDFYDTGRSFDPSTIPSPKSDPHRLIEGGYGLHIVRQIMDVVSYDCHPQRGNHWHLEKFLRIT